MDELKVYPSADDLTSVSNLVYCTEQGCSSVFKSESNLNLHLAKSHKKEELANLLTKQHQPLNRQYYCPDDSCIYNESRYFKSIKLLKQHYLKVHSEKDVLCDRCGKGYPTEASRNKHREYCGVNFKCCDCEATYTCYDTLTTHARRKKHKILPKINYKDERASVVEKKSESRVKKEQLILPKPASCTQLLLLIKTDDKCSQTDGQPKCKTRKTIREKRGIHSTQTQTGIKQPQTAETQTIGDYITKKSSSELLSCSSNESLNRKSIKTQTASVTSLTKSCNTSFNLNDFHFAEGDVEKTTLGTQTLAMLSNFLENNISLPNLSACSMPAAPNPSFDLISSGCQTSFEGALDPFYVNPLYNCNSETQTDVDRYTDFDLLSSMYTQTCDDIMSDVLEFSNNHTQTAQDALKSVGSQTTVSVNTNTSGRDTAHIETQTDAAFQQMLEEINA